MPKILTSPARTLPADPAAIDAFASSPDGGGAVVLFVSFRRPDGSLEVANVCLRLTGELRDGFVELCASRADLDAIMRRLLDTTSVELAQAPPGEIAQLVDEAAARTRATGSAIPPGVGPAVELIERVRRTPPPPAAPGRSVSMETVIALLEKPLHDAWLFDDADLARVGVGAPPTGSSRAWAASALSALARSPVRERVVAMARYMSRWWSWRGDAQRAGEWTTLAEGADRAFAECPLSTAMMMRSILGGKKTKEVAGVLARPEASPSGLAPFAQLFPEVAARETRTLVMDEPYDLQEYYCVDPACDCRRVLFRVYARERNDFVAAIGHGFRAKEARRHGMEQTFLDPMHPNAAEAPALLAAVERLLRTDVAWHQRLEDHYAMVKRSVAGPPKAPPQAAKVGPNEPCPCGSGKKYKKCCRP